MNDPTVKTVKTKYISYGETRLAIQKLFIELLNLPQHCRRFTVRYEVGDIVRVECEYFPEINIGTVKKLLSFKTAFQISEQQPKKLVDINYDRLRYMCNMSVWRYLKLLQDRQTCQ